MLVAWTWSLRAEMATAFLPTLATSLSLPLPLPLARVCATVLNIQDAAHSLNFRTPAVSTRRNAVALVRLLVQLNSPSRLSYSGTTDFGFFVSRWLASTMQRPPARKRQQHEISSPPRIVLSEAMAQWRWSRHVAP